MAREQVESSAPRTDHICEDIEQGLQWLRDQIAGRGGDAGRIYLSGHSAGAMLSAAIGLRAWGDGCSLPEDFVKGLVLISGVYDISDHSEETINRGSKRYAPRQFEAIDRLPGHTIVVAGDNDLRLCLPGAKSLVEAIKARGGSVEMFVEAGADHFAANKGFISADGAVFQATKRMMGLSAIVRAQDSF